MSPDAKKILLIEDDVNLSRVLTHVLTRDGYEVRPCLTAQTALEQVQAGFIADLVVLDLELPDNKGLNLMDQIRLNSSYRKTPIIINSGHSYFKNDFRSWLADSYLVKKSNPDELRSNVKNILARI